MTRLRSILARRLMRLPGGVVVLGMVRRAVRTGRVLVRSARHPAAAARERRRTAGWAWNELDVRVLATRVEEDRPFLNTNQPRRDLGPRHSIRRRQTMRQRNANACELFGRRAHRSSTSRSWSLSTTPQHAPP